MKVLLIENLQTNTAGNCHVRQAVINCHALQGVVGNQINRALAEILQPNKARWETV
jgi:hypothetical protein